MRTEDRKMTGRRTMDLRAAWCGLLGMSISVWGAPAKAETLAEAVNMAYRNNPTLEIQRQQLEITEESFVQARAGLRPQLSVSSVASYSNTAVNAGRGGLVDTNGDGIPDTAVGGGGGVTERNFGSASLTATQPLYSGGRTAAAMSAAEADILAARETLRDTEAAVVQSVVQAFSDVRRDQRQVEIRQAGARTLQSQLEEAQATFEVGLITRTDVEQARARLAVAQSALAAAEGQLDISRAAYAAIVGQEPGDLAPPPALDLVAPASLATAFEHADTENARLRAAEFNERGSRERIKVARAQGRPTISLRASAGYSGQLSPFETDRFARNLTGSVVTTIPLYAGGLYDSQIRQAVRRNETDQLRIDLARRQARQAARLAWNQLVTARATLAANETAVKAASIALEGVRLEYQNGLRTTLDVLNAEQERRNAELAVENARRDAYVAQSALLVAVGHLEAQTLDASIGPSDSLAHFEATHGGGLWRPWDATWRAVDALGGRSGFRRAFDKATAQPQSHRDDQENPQPAGTASPHG